MRKKAFATRKKDIRYAQKRYSLHAASCYGVALLFYSRKRPHRLIEILHKLDVVLDSGGKVVREGEEASSKRVIVEGRLRPVRRRVIHRRVEVEVAASRL